MKTPLISLVIGGLALSGCGCTEMGCVAPFGFDLMSMEDVLSEQMGEPYVFTFTMDEDISECTGTIGQEFECDGLITLSALPLRFDVEASNDTLIPRSISFTSTEVEGDVSLTIDHDGNRVFSDSFRVDLTLGYPNGRLCPAACAGWTADVAW